MQTGEQVTVRLYGGKTGNRRVVADRGSVVVICSEEEYQSALREGREPSGLGFPREDVVGLVDSGARRKKDAESETRRPPAGKAFGD